MVRIGVILDVIETTCRVHRIPMLWSHKRRLAWRAFIASRGQERGIIDYLERELRACKYAAGRA